LWQNCGGNDWREGGAGQAKLFGHAVRDGEGRKTAAMRSPLAGKLFDANGEPLYFQGAVKDQRRYRYYVSTAQRATSLSPG